MPKLVVPRFNLRLFATIELYECIHQLADEYPDLAEVVELPHETNGYRGRAQALLDPPGNRVTVDAPSPAAGGYSRQRDHRGPWNTPGNGCAARDDRDG